ncbi:hypothetical protein [Cupriavidus campinensis]|uniref:Uncharacterized protein n=1 Tax=Cupriavidus campinensis TaxID=151783 RepID=A0AAE9I0V7_9BURK|nr:hypothetical protein [Cupriavidus campinensis]URF05462.1 hypothetical protein M5D45_06560 [Cupriavidus campinensis]
MQEKLFYESVYEAIGEVVRAAGGTKKVGAMLWPEKSADAAGAMLKDCLNPDRREKLDPEQVAFIRRLGRQIGCHALMNFEAQDSGYERPKPLNSEEQARRLVDVIAQQQAQLQAAMQAFQALAEQNPQILKAVA